MDSDKKKRLAWAEKQIRTLLDIGLDLVDAEAIIKQTLDSIPEGEDLDAYIPPEDDEPVEITADDLARARAAWYADDAIPPEFKMLLDAKEVAELGEGSAKSGNFGHRGRKGSVGGSGGGGGQAPSIGGDAGGASGGDEAFLKGKVMEAVGACPAWATKGTTIDVRTEPGPTLKDMGISSYSGSGDARAAGTFTAQRDGGGTVTVYGAKGTGFFQLQETVTHEVGHAAYDKVIKGKSAKAQDAVGAFQRAQAKHDGVTKYSSAWKQGTAAGHTETFAEMFKISIRSGPAGLRRKVGADKSELIDAFDGIMAVGQSGGK